MTKWEHYKNTDLNDITATVDGISYTEERQDIVGYEGHYKVSSFGRVRALGRYVNHGRCGRMWFKERILKQKIANNGYLQINLKLDGVSLYKIVHRLVCKAFNDNSENKPQVNHKCKYGDKKYNFYRNLEWNTSKENIVHSFNVLVKPRSVSKSHVYKTVHPMTKMIKCTTLDVAFDSIKEACVGLGLTRSLVWQVCTGKIIHTKGLSFRLIE